MPAMSPVNINKLIESSFHCFLHEDF